MYDRGPCHASLCCRSVDGHPLPIDELKGIKPVESIDFSGKGLNIASAIIIGACIAGNAHLRELKCAQLFKLGGSVIAGAITFLKPLNFTNEFLLTVSRTTTWRRRASNPLRRRS